MDSCAPGCASPRFKTHAARVNVTGDWGNEDETASTLGGILSIAELTSIAELHLGCGNESKRFQARTVFLPERMQAGRRAVDYSSESEFTAFTFLNDIMVG